MEYEKIEALVKLVEDSSLTKFTYQEGDAKIVMSKLGHAPVVAPGMGVMPPMQGMDAICPTQAASAAEDEEDEDLFITSPIVGTFYSASAPDAPAYVKVGDQVKSGQTVCILEAMKLMNEIQADFTCEITAILVSNEQKVEYGQPLFKVKKI